MLEPLVLVLALATSGVDEAAPSATPAETQTLREIGHVTTSAMCTGIVMRANSAISAALRNDQTLTIAIATLRHADLDTTNQIDKQRAMKGIDRLAADLRVSAGNADAQIKKLREMAAQATDPERKVELKAFADSLGGALFQQNQIGRDMQRMLVIMDGRDARAEAHADMTSTLPEQAGLWTRSDRQGFFDTRNYDQIAQSAAKDVEDRTLVISANESKAANHIVGAVNGC